MQCSCGSVWPLGKWVDDVTVGRAGFGQPLKLSGEGGNHAGERAQSSKYHLPVVHVPGLMG